MNERKTVIKSTIPDEVDVLTNFSLSSASFGLAADTLGTVVLPVSTLGVVVLSVGFELHDFCEPMAMFSSESVVVQSCALTSSRFRELVLEIDLAIGRALALRALTMFSLGSDGAKPKKPNQFDSCANKEEL